MSDDLISREALKKYKFTTQIYNGVEPEDIEVVPVTAIDNAPTVEQECYITGAQWNEFMKEHKRLQDTLITEIIEELESRKSYGVEYAQAMEDVIVILKAKLRAEEKENETDN